MNATEVENNNLDVFQRCFSGASFQPTLGLDGVEIWDALPLVGFIIDRLKPGVVLDVGEKFDQTCIQFGASVSQFLPTAKLIISASTTDAAAYAQISSRARATYVLGEDAFDAADRFADSSVDLLRLRGALTSKLLGAWLPKLSEKAVVICDSDHVRTLPRFALSTDAGGFAIAPRLPDAIAPLLAAKAAEIDDIVLSAYARLGAGANRTSTGRLAETSGAMSIIPAKAPVLGAIGDRDLILQSGLFDRAWYLDTYPDVAADGIEPLDHYLASGAAEGRDPGPLFSGHWYMSQTPGVSAERPNPLAHFIRSGGQEGYDPHPLFDCRAYLARYQEVRGTNPLIHYIRQGAAKGYHPNLYFDGDYFLRRNDITLCPRETPLHGYLRTWRTNPEVHPLFDAAQYALRYTDWAQAGHDPLGHFYRIGLTGGRQACDPDLLLIGLTVAVVVHVENIDEWAEISGRLANLPVGFTLYVSGPAGNSPVADVVRADYPAANIKATSEGEGAAEGLWAHLPDILNERPSVLLKVGGWRDGAEFQVRRHLAYEGVMKNARQVRDILGYFATDESLAMVGPYEFHIDADDDASAGILDELAEAVYPDTTPEATVPWFAEGAVWLRPQLLEKLSLESGLPMALRDRRLGAAGRSALLDRLVARRANMEKLRIGVTRNLAPDDQFVDVGRAPGPIFPTSIDVFVAECAEKLRRANPIFKRSQKRTWRRSDWGSPGINFVGPVQAVNGLGVSARGYVNAIQEANLALSVVPWVPGFAHVKTQQYCTRNDGLQPITIVHLNLDLMTDAKLLDSPPLKRIMTPNHYNIAIIYWELISIKSEWLETIHRFDEIWVASEFMKRALVAVTKTPVHVIRPAVTRASALAHSARNALELPEDRMLFFYGADAGSTSGRKNPEAFWRAYCAEFDPGEGAACVIKIHYGTNGHPSIDTLRELHAKRGDVFLIDRTLTEEEMNNLFASIDCYVSPQRSEGLGLTIIESMLAGKPVISTNYGGVADFVTDHTAFLVKYRLSEVGEGSAPYPAQFVWADPDIDSLRGMMRTTFEDPVAAGVIAQNGRALVEELFGLANTSSEITKHVARIWASGASPVSTRKSGRRF